MTLLMTENGFVDADLIGAAELRIRRLETGGVGVIVIARNRAIGIQRARFEDSAPIAVPHDKVDPGAPRWIRSGEFVAILIANNHVSKEAARFRCHIFDDQRSRLRL